MTEGELKKRIKAGEYTRYQPDSTSKIWFEDKPAVQLWLIEQTLDEAKNDFPTSGIGDSHENAVINGMHKTQQWFKKWFGDST